MTDDPTAAEARVHELEQALERERRRSARLDDLVARLEEAESAAAAASARALAAEAQAARARTRERATGSATVPPLATGRPGRPLAALTRWASNLVPAAAADRVGARLPFWDEAWYLDRHPEVRSSRLSPAMHFRRHGSRAGWSPHPLFDEHWYRHVSGCGPDDSLVEHFLDEGAAAGLSPHPLFDTAWYLERYAPREANPLVDYLRRWPAGAAPHPLVDVTWYAARHGSLLAGRDPLSHYLLQGAALLLAPHPLFDTAWYLRHSPDVLDAGTNPLAHYVLHGSEEGRDPHPLVEVGWYRRTYGLGPGTDPLRHYLEEGAAHGFDPGGIFCTAWYREQHRDVGDTNPLVHFVVTGLRRGDAPSPWARDLPRPLAAPRLR